MHSRGALTAVVALVVVLAGVAAPVVAGVGEASAAQTTQTSTAASAPESGASAETAAGTETVAEAPTTTDARTRTPGGERASANGSSPGVTATDRRSANVPNATRAKVASNLLDGGDGGKTAGRVGTMSVGSSDESTGQSVVVELDASNVGAGRAAVARVLGPDARAATHGRYVETTATREQILALANEPAVSYVRTPARPVSFAGADGTTEAVQTARLESLHARGYGGENVTVAVVDLSQFDLDNPALEGRVSKTRDFTGDGIDTAATGGHGTATAELVAETAPNASLVLVRVNSLVGFYNAVDWIESNTSADVVSMSLGWYNVGPLDGTSEMDDAINGSVDSGTSWVISAGNAADGNHWNGTWTDGDGDGLLNVTPTREYFPLDANGRVRMWAQWDDWPNSGQDYDLCLYASPDVESADPIRCSRSDQTGFQDPTEYITVDASAYDTVYLTIERANADGTADFDVFLNDRTTFSGDDATKARSTTLPAANRRAVSVGAYRHGTGALESFSSRGPTADGRVKPDVVAADGVTSSVYNNGFFGTSAAAPHAAGVLATLLDANRRLAPDDLKANLTSSARARGTVPNNQTGYGEVDASRAVAGLGAYDLPPDGRLRYDGGYRLDTGGSSVPDSVVVDAANVTVDGEGGTFAAVGDGVALSTTGNATNLTVRDLTVTDRPVGVEASNLTTLELTNVTALADSALRVSNVSDVRLTNVSPPDAPSFDLRGENVSLVLDGTNAPPNRSRLSAAPNLTFVGGAANATTANETNATTATATDTNTTGGTTNETTTNVTNATVTLRYDESYADESTVAVWTNAGGEWTETNASVDTEANTVTFEATENGTYGVYAVGKPAANLTRSVSVSTDVDAATTANATVTNVGRTDLTVLDADLIGPDADQFGVPNGPKNVTVRPGGTLDVQVEYAPNDPGSHAATLSVTIGELGVFESSLDGTASVPTTPTPTPTSTPADESDDSSDDSSSDPPPAPAPAPTSTPTATPTPTPTTSTPAATPTATPTATPASTATPPPQPAEASERRSETPTATETPTPREPTDADESTATPTPAVTGTGVPGFSPVTAAVALAAAAALLARRD